MMRLTSSYITMICASVLACAPWHQPDTLMRGVVSMQIQAHWFGDATLDVMPEVGWRYERVEPTPRLEDY